LGKKIESRSEIYPAVTRNYVSVVNDESLSHQRFCKKKKLERNFHWHEFTHQISYSDSTILVSSCSRLGNVWLKRQT